MRLDLATYAGLERAPQAIVDLLAGRTRGKDLVTTTDGRDIPHLQR
jgi:NADPH-dependent curcumin reductase CurA